MRFRKLLIAFVFLVAVGIAYFVSYFVGEIVGNVQVYKRQYRQERNYFEPRISGNSAYSRVSIEMKSDGGIYLMGSVATNDDLERLRSELIQSIGEPRSKEAIMGVEVKLE